MERLDITNMGLNETFWRGQNNFVISLPSSKEYRVVSGGGYQSRKGMAIIADRFTCLILSATVLSSEHVATIVIKGHLKDIMIIQVYAPTLADYDEDLKKFYENIGEAMKISSGKKDRVIILMGDWNAKVGKERISVAVGPFDQ
ncbi:unnamed protein product [Caretta caretta]